MLSPMDLLGWTGGIMGAVAYVLVSNRRIRPDSATFQGLNMVGAAMLATASFSAGAIPSAGMNAIWIVFGLHALVTGGRRTDAEQPASGSRAHRRASSMRERNGARTLCAYRRTPERSGTHACYRREGTTRRTLRASPARPDGGVTTQGLGLGR